jgi:hypothetical protein
VGGIGLRGAGPGRVPALPLQKDTRLYDAPDGALVGYVRYDTDGKAAGARGDWRAWQITVEGVQATVWTRR